MHLRMKHFAPTFLRIGIALVFIYFGVMQIQDPKQWIDYLPAWTAKIPLSQINFIYLNGAFDLIFGALMLFGFYTRIVALLLSLYLFGIAFEIGFNPTGVRDLGLAIATFAIFLFGS